MSSSVKFFEPTVTESPEARPQDATSGAAASSAMARARGSKVILLDGESVLGVRKRGVREQREHGDGHGAEQQLRQVGRLQAADDVVAQAAAADERGERR